MACSGKNYPNTVMLYRVWCHLNMFLLLQYESQGEAFKIYLRIKYVVFRRNIFQNATLYRVWYHCDVFLLVQHEL